MQDAEIVMEIQILQAGEEGRGSNASQTGDGCLIKPGWQMRKWKQNFKDCRLEKKEEVVMHHKRLIAVWRRWWNRFSPWERISEV